MLCVLSSGPTIGRFRVYVELIARNRLGFEVVRALGSLWPLSVLAITVPLERVT